MAGSCDREGDGKSGSLPDVQSAVRAYLARIEKAPSGVCFPKTGQSRTREPIFDSLLRLGKKVRRGPVRRRNSGECSGSSQ